MEPDLAVQILRESLTVMFEVAGPILLVALVSGTLIAVLQAATQVNEMTLSFVPKLAAVGALLWTMSSFLLGKLTAFGERMFELVAALGGAR
jgi:flagellar biosynthetic protein FliQ